MVIRRGSVWWADLGYPRGSEPANYRPVVVISADEYNASSVRTVTVAVLTRSPRRAAVPGNVAVPAGEAGLDDDSVVDVTQLVSINKIGLQEETGSLPDWLMAQLDDGLRKALALP